MCHLLKWYTAASFMCSLHYNEYMGKANRQVLILDCQTRLPTHNYFINLSLMPNHCSNRVSFYSDDTTAILKLYNIFENGTNPKTKETVFGSFIPEPDWKNIPLNESTVQEYSWDNPRGEVGELPVESDDPYKGLHFPSTGKQDDRWYNWRNQNWGTKWDCYDLMLDEEEMPNGFTAEFNTAWCPPEEVASAIKEQFDDLSMSWFYDEPGCEVAGYL